MQITETHGGIPVNMEVEWGHAVNLVLCMIPGRK